MISTAFFFFISFLPTDLYLLAGQSNMGELAYIKQCPPKYLKKYVNIKIFNDNNWENLPLKNNTFGPELAIALILSKKYPNKKIGLVKFRKYGKSLENWLDENNFLGECINLLKNVKNNSHPDAKINATFWMQGESDAYSIKTAKAYKKRLIHVFDRLKKEANNPNLFFIYGQTVTPKNKIGLKHVRDFQKNLNYKNAFMIRTDKYKRHRDGIHFTAVSQLLFGTDLVNKYLEISK